MTYRSYYANILIYILYCDILFFVFKTIIHFILLDAMDSMKTKINIME